ncbi:serine hydrolase domain-containing protein [Microbacterium sp. TPD7012]|uniref:serine hydrolase domain-containing protein n=1 Tax=Microbacterium sp. TPD7012 TaxID=2171975 RepID=UPI000D5221A8|nr:serine hydrolase domain-containing protein [Microbacterium sp. TPD7012]PVE94784.1 D-alanyl-D-alanine carboxypeptidase [Microbacterium sp. TPD7012]
MVGYERSALRRGASRSQRLLAVVATAAVAVGLAGCAAPAPEASAKPSAAADGAVEFDAATLTAMFEEQAEEMMLPGAVVIVRTPDGDIEVPYGVTEWGGSTPVTLDDHIRIGSNTKTWTGTVILQLVEDGRIALEDPVSKYRPDVPNGDNITIEQLLTMRSGLFNYTTTLELNAALDETPDRVWDPEELVRMGLAGEPYFAPGEGYMYSNTNTVLLGLIAEQLEGKKLPEIYQERLFEPLGLTETSFPALADASIAEPVAHGYMFSNNVDTMEGSALPADELAAAQAGELLPTDHTDDNPSWAWSAGAGISTAPELATWVEALGGGGVLSDEMQQKRIESVQPSDGEGAYGWGVAGMGSFYGHIGEMPGYNSFMGYDPETDVTVVVWATLAPNMEGNPAAALIARSLIEKMYGL